MTLPQADASKAQKLATVRLPDMTRDRKSRTTIEMNTYQHGNPDLVRKMAALETLTLQSTTTTKTLTTPSV